MNSKDILFMKRALVLAARGQGRVHPNPLVGAVVVKNNRVVGEGAHLNFGGPHAEVHAVQVAGAKARGGVLYVTLEPCAHHGKTPPCADFLARQGIQRVVAAAKDPNPLVAGKGFQILRKAGIQVKVGVMEKEALELNKDFNYWVIKKMPYVIVKVAQSLDGKIATRTGESRWITDQEARAFSHGLRAQADAILVGVGTVLADDPLLNVRAPSSKASPIKVVVDSHLRTPPRAKIFSEGRVILAVTQKAPAHHRRLLEKKAEVLVVKEKRGRVDLGALLKILAARGICRVLVEGGGEVIASLFKERLVQEVYFFIAPKIIGGRDSVHSVSGEGIASLKDAVSLKRWRIKPVGKDLLVHGSL
jgi:diaminohydroxyphosphoribosylaminopyrimidine deaminase/5-amino-6-(5-phosphoribosylamino)uracil reductase